MGRTAKSIECGLSVVQGKEQWRYKSFGYLAKRGDRLFVNILIEDVNSKCVDGGHTFILTNCVISKRYTDVQYSELNNCNLVQLTQGQRNLVVECARAIYKEYFKEEE